MCLDVINRNYNYWFPRKVKNSTVSGFGYKVFQFDDNHIYGCIMRGSMGVPIQYELDKWYKSPFSFMTKSLWSGYYLLAYHIFENKVDAQSYRMGYGKGYKLYYVEYEGILSIGKQNYSDTDCTVVAKKMKLLHEVE